MKKINFILIGIAILTIFGSHCSSRRGVITVVNTQLKSVNISFNGKDVALQPEQHYTQKGMKPGIYFVKVGTETPLKVEIKKKKTTLVDIAGDNCFVVADYTNQYDEGGDGKIKIVKKYVNEKTFITPDMLTAELGEELPKVVHHNEQITRIHRVDCSWIDNDQAIIDAIANMP